MSTIPLLLAVLVATAAAVTDASIVRCDAVEAAFRAAAENDSEPCSCFDDDEAQGVGLECAASSLPTIFATLRVLNETSVSKIRIRDSLLNILPADIFTNLKPRSLSIERCSLSVLREESINVVGSRLRKLSLRNNRLKNLEKYMFQGLTRLQKLDVSGNKLTSIAANTFEDCKDLTEIVLNNNEIAVIEPGTFANLTSLKTLSLIGNKITSISKDTFAGLESLEVLQLQGNEIVSIDWAAFAGMSRLKTLNLGTNHIANVELRGLDNLQKLFLNNNSINSLKSVSLRDLPALSILSFDRNQITSIGDVDLFGLSRSTRLESIALASNNISHISPRAFQSVQNLQSLSLQNNHITDLSTNGTAYLMPLKKLTTLQLSANQLVTIRADELPKSVVTLAADHNQIAHIDGRAFEGISLKRLYLNNNKLKFLNQHTFDSFAPETIDAIDVSSNNWQCVCGKEWLPGWLEKAGDSDVADGYLGCLAIWKCAVDSTAQGDELKEDESRSVWVTAIAATLALVSLLILVAIAVLYIKDGYQRPTIIRPLHRRIDSDLHKLIDNDPLIQTDVEPSRKTPAGDKKKVRFET
ncbi:unnamed protein product [Caenorhabditis auriculariae]|uniref:LRRCT domain-containing protein n=1 Tax=Caenorhabditis auriculariae TaxID=2777116 RepID=A0A8S1GRS5_9PELO|nr:unnamed protein product [Caenorhabditis auriculariae]